MNRKEAKEPEKRQQTPETQAQKVWEKYSSPPMDFIMKNPKMTPVILLILAAVPIATVAFILGILLLGH